jgi:hypothetical protein
MEYAFGHETALLIGASFLCGGATGFGVGALVGLSRNLDELPLIRLNQTLNTATWHAERWAYECAMVTSLAVVTKSMADKANMNPIAAYTSAGAVVGAFGGSHWGARSALEGGVLGAAVGAAVGFFADPAAFDRVADRVKALL